MNVVVIGGGIAGLAAAFELAERGVEFVLLEASSRAGGLILTEHVDGFTIEAGPDSVLVQKASAIELAEQLGLGPRLISTNAPRTAYILDGGRLHPLPSPSVLGIPTTWWGVMGYGLLGPTARARLAAEPLVRRRRSEDDESVASFFRRRFGRATVDLIAQPLLGGIHAGDVERLSIKSLFPRFVEAESRRGSVIRAFRRTRAASDGLFRSLASGMYELVQGIERRLPAGSVRLSCPATAVQRSGDCWVVSSRDESFCASDVILATPAYATAELVGSVDSVLAGLCAEVPYVSTASVTLAWPRASVSHPLEGSGFVTSRRGSARITACTWVSSKWPGRAPAGFVLLRAFIGGSHDPEGARLPEGALIEIAVRDLSPVLGITGAPVLARVHRWLDAAAQHVVGHLARVDRIEDRLAALPGLHLAGSGARSIGIPDCVADGRTAGAKAAARHADEGDADHADSRDADHADHE